MPFLEAADYGQEFFVIDLIIIFGNRMLLREEGNGVENAIVIILRHHSSRNIVGSIGFQDNISGLVEQFQDRCINKSSL